jgi:hypothetical protein
VRPRNAILLAAVILYVVAYYVPFGSVALYPLSLFTTWVHEMGHGITAIAVGGRFEYLEIFRDGSGLAHCVEWPGWQHGLVSMGGLLAPPVTGAILLATVHGPRRAKIALGVLAAALVISMLVYVRSAAGLIAMPIVAAGLVYAGFFAFRAAPERRVIVAQVLAVILAFDTLTRMVSYVFTDEVVVDGKKSPSDITNVAHNLGGPVFLWGCAITAIAVALLWAGLWWAWRASAPTAPRAGAKAPARTPSRSDRK